MWIERTFHEVPHELKALAVAEEIRVGVLNKGERFGRCDLDKVCAAGGFRPREVKLSAQDGGLEALLVPEVDGSFAILVDSDPPGRTLSPRVRRHRYRFRVAHEIGHSFFFDRSVKPAKRLLSHSSEEEAFCDAFAGALLVHPQISAKERPTPEAVFRLSKTFDVSLQVAGRALAKSHKSIIVLAVGWRPPGPHGKEPAWRILWGVGPTFIPSNMRLRSEVVDLALEMGHAKGPEELTQTGIAGEFLVNAKSIPPSSSVLVVMTPTDTDRRKRPIAQQTSLRI